MSQAQTLTTNLTAAQITMYEDDFLSLFEERIVAERFGQVVNMPWGTGKVVDFFRYHPLAKITSAGSEGKSGDFTFAALTGMNLTATLEEWYGIISFSMQHYRTSRDRTLTRGVKRVAVQAAESSEYNVIKTLAENNIWPLPASAFDSTGTKITAVSTAYQEGITLHSTNSTTVLYLKGPTFSRSAKDGALIGGWVCFALGKGYGHCSRISAYASASRKVTLANASPEAAASASETDPTTITIGSPFELATKLTAGDKIDTGIINKAGEILFRNRAEPFDDGDYVILMPAEVHTQLLGDVKWRETATRSPASADGGYQNAEIARWGRFRVFRTTLDAHYAGTAESHLGTGAFSTAGAVNLTFCLGKDSFGVVGLDGVGQPNLILKTPSNNDGNTSNPVNTFGTAAWYRSWIVKPLNANFCVGIMSWV